MFEDASGDLTLAWDPSTKPRTKHINVKYHNFCTYVVNSTISIIPIEPANQPSYMPTNPFN